jgi:hypothetical protein
VLASQPVTAIEPASLLGGLKCIGNADGIYIYIYELIKNISKL